MAGFKGRIARMLLNFLDEHGNYRESLEEAAARAAAAEANSLLARDRRGRKKGRRSRNTNKNIETATADDNEEDDWEEEDELPKLTSSTTTPINNGLPEDPYEQIQFYIATFKSRTSTQLREQLHHYKSTTTNWLHEELHHTPHVSTTSLLILLFTTLTFIWRRRTKTYNKYQRIHSILGKKFDWKTYLHPTFIRGYLLYQIAPSSVEVLRKLQLKSQKAEEVALSSMRPYLRKRYERLSVLEIWGDRLVSGVLVLGMVLSGMTFCMSLHSLIRFDGHHNNNGIGVGGEMGEDGGTTTNGGNSQTDGYIYSLEGETDSDGYPIHLREVAEQRYAECIIDAEAGGNDPKELCDLNSFFGSDDNDDILNSSVVRMKINALLKYIGIPSVISTYLTTLPSQTVAYLSSLFTLCLFVLSHYISHKIHVLTMSNDPMKHFVVVDKTVKADGTVEAKRGETEAQRKKRERMLQAERYKAQMAQLAYEAKTKAQARMARLEGVEAAKRMEEEKEKKIVEEQDETVKMYGRQFMMIKAGVPDGAILNSFLPMGIEEEEAKEILVKLHAIKERRSAEAKKAEEEEAKKAEEEKKAEEMKERIAADRLKKMKSGKLPGGVGGGPPSMGLPSSSTTATVRRGSKKVVKTEAEKAEEARRTEAMKEHIAAASATGAKTTTTTGPEKAEPGLKVAQPWASPGKKERRGAKNKRWDKVTKSWVDRDLETEGTDSVPIAVVLKDEDEGGKEDSMEQEEFKVFAPAAHKVAEVDTAQSPVLPPKKLVTPSTARKEFMISPSAAADESKMKSEFKAFVPTHISPSRASVDKKDNGESAPTNNMKVVEKKYDANKFNPISPRDEGRNNTEKSEETKVTSQASSQSSSPPPVLLRVTESPDDDVFSPQALDINNPSAWSRRSTTRDIKAMIEAVEAAPDDEVEDLFLGPTSHRTPAFEAAMRASEASWDRRPSSRDIIAKIREAEQQEANIEIDKVQRRSSKSKGRMLRIDEGKNMIKHDSKIGTSLLKKTKSQGGINSDDEISEISMVDELSVTSATFASPKQLKKPNVRMAEYESSKIPKLGVFDKSDAAKTKDEVSEAGTDVTSKISAAKSSEPKEETEEDKLRKKKADERAKKFEEMNARRRKGKGEDDGTAVSGISRRQRIRRKRSALAAITPDEKKRDDWKRGIFASVLNVEQEKWKKSIYAHVINAEETRAANIKAREELEELNAAAKRRAENQKRLEAKAKKFAARAEKFHKLRRHGDDGSVVSSASRMRRRRSRKPEADTPPRKSTASSSEAASVDETSVAPQSQTESIVEEKDNAHNNENDVSQESESKQQEATDPKVTCESMELIKENENDASAETEQKDESTVESPDQREDEMNVMERDLEGKDVAEHGVQEVNAALNSVIIEQTATEEEASPAANQNEGEDNNQLDDSEAKGIDAHASYDEVLDQLESEKGGEVTPISASNNDEEKKTETEESETPSSKSPISAMKNMKNRRKAAAKKKKNAN